MTARDELPTIDAPAWEFHRGQWREITDPIAWPAEGDWEETLRALGYTGAGAIDLETVRIFEATRQSEISRRYRYVLWVCPSLFAGAGGNVYLPDLPDLLDVLPKLAYFATEEIGYRLAQIDDYARKAFRAWHGHGADWCCPQCDPDAWEARQERRRQAAENKAKPKQNAGATSAGPEPGPGREPLPGRGPLTQ